MPADVEQAQQDCAAASQPPDAGPGPWEGGLVSGFGQHTNGEGTYKGWWVDGRPHGNGTFHYNTGVRYSGNWQNGQPFGEGKWTHEKPPSVPPPKPKAAKCKCKVPGASAKSEPISYSVHMRHDWPVGTSMHVNLHLSNQAL